MREVMKLKSIFIVSFSIFTLLSLSCSRELTEEEIAKKAAEIHDKVLTVDTHCDTPFRLRDPNYDISQRHEPEGRRGGKIDLPRMKEGGLDAEFFAVFLGQGPLTPERYESVKQRALETFEAIHKMCKDYPELCEFAAAPEDAYRIEKAGKRAIFTGIENGYPIGEDLSLIKKFYDLGARYITLCHSSDNQICDSSTDRRNPEDRGLSEFGRKVVDEMNRLGIIIDVSHISDKSFFDVIARTKAPVIASHSCARAMQDNPRNLSDEMLLKLKENGGVIQMCILSGYVKEYPNPERDAEEEKIRKKYPNFENLSEEQRREAMREFWELRRKYPAKLATVSDAVDHIDHIVNLIGIDYVGIGTDFDGGGGLEDCFDVSQMGNITKELVKRGYSEKDIRKIWGGNFMRVFNKVIEVSKKLQ